MLKILQVFLFALATLSTATAASVSFVQLPGTYQNSTFNGFATATVDGFPNQLLICDDHAGVTYMPSSNLLFTVSTLDGPDPLHGARFVSSTGAKPAEITLYREAAVLLSGLLAAGPNANLVTDYQYALWHLFNPSAPLYRAGAEQSLLDNALLAVNQNSPTLGDVYSSLRVYTPTAAFASNQEFLQLVPAPEPAQGLPMLAGIGAVWFGLWRRRTPSRRQ